MLFNLKFVEDHPIYRFHQDVILFFQSAFLNKAFNDDLFTEELLHIINLSRDNVLRTKFQDVYIALKNPRIKEANFMKFIITNNNIFYLCANPRKKISLNHKYNDLLDKTKKLYSHLWESSIKTQGCIESYRSIYDHYETFFKLNCRPYNLCPFCGLEKYQNPDLKRSAYDHYLCQQYYPEQSINFLNLIPMPDNCNSGDIKGGDDILFNKPKNIPRKAHYPYDPFKVRFTIKIDCEDIFGQYESWHVCVNQIGKKKEETFITWKEVFNIERRWAIEIKYNCTYWIQNFANEYRENSPKTITEISKIIPKYITLIKGRAKEPGYFLEIAFWKFILTKNDYKELIIYYMQNVLKFDEAA